MLNSKYIVFDVETTGLPTNYNASPKSYNMWPNIVQFSWIINDNGNLTEKSYIIKPDKYIIPEDSIKIHNITNEEALKNGIPIKTVLNFFKEDCDKVDYLVAHNSSFDTSVIYAACYRTNSNLSFNIKVLCTMKSTTNLCKLENKNKKYKNYKYPKLEELYEFLFGKKPQGITLHNSLEDARITLICYQELLTRNIKIV
jgi:DNA polymerase-3 subunit alpha